MNIKHALIWIFSASTLVFSMSADKKAPKSKSQWQDLKVLPENISEDSLKQVMRAFNTGLGVKCGFCHAKDESTGKMDFASNANKHKDITRKMYKMTYDINHKYFDQKGVITMNSKVSCATCHNGHESPQKIELSTNNTPSKN